MAIDEYLEPRKRVKPQKELSVKEQRFLDLILDGWTKISASLEVFFGEEDWEDEVIREKAKRKYSGLLNTKRAVKYLALNRNRALIFVPTDMDKVATHISDICFGNAVRKIQKMDKDGNVVELEETPGFQDQIAAAIFLKNYCEFLERKKTIPVRFEDRKDEIDEKAKKFTEGWKTRRIEQSPFVRRNLTEDVLSDQIDREVEAYDSGGER